jgi:hypothetical protein
MFIHNLSRQGAEKVAAELYVPYNGTLDNLQNRVKEKHNLQNRVKEKQSVIDVFWDFVLCGSN